MSMRRVLLLLTVMVCAGMAPLGAAAQSVRVLGDHNAWSAYATTESAGQICFILARPSSTEPTPEGYTEGYFYITHRPSAGIRSEINLVAGYDFAPDSQAVMRVGGQEFPMFTQADAAWLADPSQTQAATAAIRAGSTMTVEGTSLRGIKVTQTFSLSGATAASREIDNAC
ncbi:invasion associated locus B family protein [Pelagibacterium xiamenense]|uniref:invasion associated locus B family protein n=1 Tax=Pelagibacterium xiamenense TaxID=2901140 RepID=UPI001E5DB25A|nr:invasion associated locus B family protein [Pelagibacterium xiamenense]MCD7058367.1 invasion associated locus B family protein [Pelagibacterium xiamenense]